MLCAARGGAGTAELRRGARRAPVLGDHVARPPRRAGADAACRQVGAAAELAAAGRHLAGPAARHRAQRRQALPRAQRRRLAGGGGQRLGQPVEHAHTRRLDADHAARRPDRRRPRATEHRPQRGAEDRPGRHGDAARAAVEEEPDPRGLSERRAAARRAGRHAGAVADAVRQARERAGRHREAAITAALVRAPNAPPAASRSAPARCWRCSSSAAPASKLRARARCRAAAACRWASNWRRTSRARPSMRKGRPCSAARSTRVLQRLAIETLRHQLAELTGRNVEDGAIVVLDNSSGEVLAWVGSSGNFSDAAQVDGVLARRQPGSTLKPFVYASGLRETADHAGQPARRFASADRHEFGPVPAAELRPRVQGLGECAHRTRREPERAGGARGRHARARRAVRAAQCLRAVAERVRRLPRPGAGAGRCRRHAARADQRLPRAGQRRAWPARWPLLRGAPAAPASARIAWPMRRRCTW